MIHAPSPRLSSTSPGRLLLYWLWKRAPGEGKGKVRTRVRVRVTVRVKARVRVRVEARALIEEQCGVHGAHCGVALARLVDHAQRQPVLLDGDLGGDDATLLAILGRITHGVAVDVPEQLRVDVDRGQLLRCGDDREERATRVDADAQHL
eukprot:scaffold22869_cov45-Phaeocystis_antarctica.AAC.3